MCVFSNDLRNVETIIRNKHYSITLVIINYSVVFQRYIKKFQINDFQWYVTTAVIIHYVPTLGVNCGLHNNSTLTEREKCFI